MRRGLVAAAVLMLTAAGCGDADTDNDDNKSAGTDESSASPGAGAYVAQVSQLCEDLIDDVVPITGDSARPTGATFLADRVQLRPVWDAFDAEVKALEVGEGDRATADTFLAFLAASDASDELLDSREAEIAAMDATQFEATLDEVLEQTGWVAKRNELLALGIECPAR